MIFVFGSNYAGRHGAGAALFAARHKGAKYGYGKGLKGQSYAIPTKNSKIQTLPLDVIEKHVQEFIRFAKNHPELKFELTPIGCGLAGYSYDQIGPMFKDAPSNVIKPKEFMGR